MAKSNRVHPTKSILVNTTAIKEPITSARQLTRAKPSRQKKVPEVKVDNILLQYDSYYEESIDDNEAGTGEEDNTLVDEQETQIKEERKQPDFEEFKESLNSSSSHDTHNDLI